MTGILVPPQADVTSQTSRHLTHPSLSRRTMAVRPWKAWRSTATITASSAVQKGQRGRLSTYPSAACYAGRQAGTQGNLTCKELPHHRL